MTEPLALLERVVDVANVVIDGPRNVSFADDVLDGLLDQAKRERLKPREKRMMGDEAVMLMQAVLRIVWSRQDALAEDEQRWTLIAGAIRPFVNLDLARAQAEAAET